MTDPHRSQRPIVQNVTVVNGFAYGVIGADIHIFGDGVPVYLLANWRPEPDADPAWLRELPSRMLNARFAVVDFTGRDVDLAGLHNWKNEGPRLAVRWMHGPGGQGKTRLAARLANEAAAQGWKVVSAIHGPGTVIPPQGSEDLRIDEAPGVLLVVDYADRWPLTHLTSLLGNGLLHRTGVPARVLLVARSDDSWPAVRAALANHQAGTSTQLLEPLPDQQTRSEMFTAARDSFATRYGIDPKHIEQPGRLDSPDMGLTLTLHMAALVAVDAYTQGRRPPWGMADLTIYLLDRENLHWATLYGDGTHELNPQERAYHTLPAVMNRVVFVAALTGAVPTAVGMTILEELRLDSNPQQALADHVVCYPAAASMQGTVLEPLYPDRLAEDFLALTLPGHSADYPAAEWASTTTVELSDRDGSGVPPAYIARTLTFLAAASAPGRWKHTASYLSSVLTADPQLAIDAGSAAMSALAEAIGIDTFALEAIESLFPADRSVNLDTGIAAIATTLTRRRLASITDPAVVARLHANLGDRLSNAARWEEALASATEAVRLFRMLAASRAETYEPDLAGSLNRLGNYLSDLGRREDALAVTTEAVGLYRRLAAGRPDVFEPDLAGALDNLGYRFSSLGRREEALATAGEAVGLYRRLAAGRLGVFESDLANVLTNLGIWLSELGRLEDALAAASEAVQIRQRLAQARPDTYAPNLATSLNNLGIRLSQLGRREEALAVASDAVQIRRHLAADRPETFEPDLARALTNLGIMLSQMGRRDDALTTTNEAVERYRRLAAARPDRFEPELALALNGLGNRSTDLGRREGALTATGEAVELYRRLAAARPDAFEPDLAKSLTNLGIRFSQLDRREEALAATGEAVELYRRLAAVRPDAFEPDLATSLNNFGSRLAELGRREEALAPTSEAVEIRRRLATARPDAFEPHLAMSVDTLGIRLAELGRPDEALAVGREAVELYRRLATAHPAAFEPDLARALGNLGVWLSRLRRQEEALAATNEAVEIRRRLPATMPNS